MATFTQDKKITSIEVKKAIKEFLPFSVNKIGENLFDMLITVLITMATLAWIVTMQPINVTLGEMLWYIITFFVLIIVRRVIQDFDEAYTDDEIGDALTELTAQVAEVHRMLKAETTLNDDELDERLATR